MGKCKHHVFQVQENKNTEIRFHQQSVGDSVTYIQLCRHPRSPAPQVTIGGDRNLQCEGNFNLCPLTEDA